MDLKFQNKMCVVFCLHLNTISAFLRMLKESEKCFQNKEISICLATSISAFPCMYSTSLDHHRFPNTPMVCERERIHRNSVLEKYWSEMNHSIIVQ